MNLSHYKISSWWVYTWDKYQVFLGKGSCRAPLNIIHEGSSGLSPLHFQQCLLNQSAGSSYGPETPGKTQLSVTFWMCLRCVWVNYNAFPPCLFLYSNSSSPPRYHLLSHMANCGHIFASWLWHSPSRPQTLHSDWPSTFNPPLCSEIVDLDFCAVDSHQKAPWLWKQDFLTLKGQLFELYHLHASVSLCLSFSPIMSFLWQVHHKHTFSIVLGTQIVVTLGGVGPHPVVLKG